MTPYEYSLFMAEMEAEAAPKPVRPAGADMNRYYGISKSELIRQTKPLLEESFSIDPYDTERYLEVVLGPVRSRAFVLDNLTREELALVRRAIYPIVMRSR